MDTKRGTSCIHRSSATAKNPQQCRILLAIVRTINARALASTRKWAEDKIARPNRTNLVAPNKTIRPYLNWPHVAALPGLNNPPITSLFPYAKQRTDDPAKGPLPGRPCIIRLVGRPADNEPLVWRLSARSANERDKNWRK